MYLRHIIVLGFLILTTPTLAQDESARMPFRNLDLLMTCQPEANFEERLGRCVSYLHGVMDANIMMSAIEGRAPVFCLPSGGIGGFQALKIYVKWADAHPEQLHQHRRIGVTHSLLSAFPCD